MKESLLILEMPSNWRITVTLPERIKTLIENWAESENRSVSNLAATILINAVEEKEVGVKETQQSNEHQS